ncbi:hypothetical protein C4544_04720, partial [candidate division WS5 bacterium]
MNSREQNSFYKRNDKILTIIIILIGVMLLDLVSATAFNYIKGKPFFQFLYEEKRRGWIEDLTS